MESLTVPPSTTKDTQAYRIASTLMDLLNDNSVPQALWWLDDHTFAADPKYFQTQVLDPYFRGTKYASFLRTMHKMGFARLSRRFDLPKGVVAYACELFRKEKPELMHKIRMCNSGKQAQALKEAMAKAKAAQQLQQKQQEEAETKAVEADKKAEAEGEEGEEAEEAPSSPKVKAKTVEVEAPGSPSAAAKRPDPPSIAAKAKKGTDLAAAVSPSLAAAAVSPSVAAALVNPSSVSVEDYLNAKAADSSAARLHLLREQASIELNAQRMFLQRQQLEQQEQMRRMTLLQQQQAAAVNPFQMPLPMTMPMPPMPTPASSNLLELALLQEALANRLSGRR